MNIRKSIIGVAVLGLATVALFTGCASDKNQIVDSISGDGFYAKAAVPVGSGSSIGLIMAVGRFNHTLALQPTDTNAVHAASLTIAVAGAGKQTVSGATGTNATASATAGITDGSRDVSIITSGDAALTADAGTNASLNITGK